MGGGLGRISATAFLISLLDGMAAIENYRPPYRDFVIA
jgi:hypothetical protein